MVTIKQINSLCKNIWIYFAMEVNEFKQEFKDIFSMTYTGALVSSQTQLSLPLVTHQSEIKKKEKRKIEKGFSPDTHIITKTLQLPKDRDLLYFYLNDIPKGYGVLEPVDINGYSIEDINVYHGDIKLIFYNIEFVSAVGVYDETLKEYIFDSPGRIVDYGYNSLKQRNK